MKALTHLWLVADTDGPPWILLFVIAVAFAIVFGVLRKDRKARLRNQRMQKFARSLNNAERLEVKLMVDGTIFVDDVKVSLDELESQLVALKEKNGVVWYYREDGQSEAPSIALEIVRLVAANRLPITISSEPDFSTAVGVDGIPRPR